jgi:general secretion pathway protein F
MATYNVKIQTSRGIHMINRMPAFDAAHAMSIGQKQGKVLAVEKNFLPDLERGLSLEERYAFLRKLAVLIASGIAVTESLRLISLHYGGRIRNSANKLLQLVEQGIQITDAMELNRKDFPAATIALIRAGSKAGNTADALVEAAKFEEDLARSQKTSMLDMYKAIAAFIAAALIMVGTTEFFGPMMMNLDILRSRPDVGVDQAFFAGRVLSASIMVMLLFGAILVALSTIGKRVAADFSDYIVMKVPLYRDVALARVKYVTFYGLSLLIKTGVQIVEALELTWRETEDGMLKTDLHRAMMAAKTGKTSWAEAMHVLDPLDKAALSSAVNKIEIAMTLNLLAVEYRDIYFKKTARLALALYLIAVAYMALAQLVVFWITVVPMLQFVAM